MSRYTIVLAAALAAASAAGASAQSLNDVRSLFDTGQYQQAIGTGGASQDPRVIFVVAQAHQKLRQSNEARGVYERLSARPDAWGPIGRSAVAVLSSNAAGALQEADQAVAAGGSIAEAHYQRGLALAAKQDMAAAA